MNGPIAAVKRELITTAGRQAAARRGLAQRAAPSSTGHAAAGRRLWSRGPRRAAAAIVLALSFAAVGTVALGAVTGLWSGLPLGVLTTGEAPSSSLTSILGVLRRSQTAADRNAAAVAVGGSGPVGYRGTIELTGVRLATKLPNGVEVFLVPTRASKLSTQTDGLHEGVGVFVGLGGHPSGGGCCSDAAHIRLIGRGGLTAGIPRGATTKVLVVPDGVARVRWIFGRQVSPVGRVYRTPLTLDVPVHGNVAAVTTRAREGQDLEPVRVAWYAADGRTIKTYNNPYLPQNPNAVIASPHDAPPTALSRRAQADPATPNPVTINPTHGGARTAFNLSFRIVLKGSGYAWTLSGPRGAACQSPTAAQHVSVLGPLQVRGQPFAAPELPPPTGWCAGSYQVAVAAIGPNGHQYGAFGHATFKVSL